MTEQSLMDYEGAKFELDTIAEDFNELRAKMYSASSVDYSKTGSKATPGQYDNRIVNYIDKAQEVQEAHKIALSEWQTAIYNYALALTVLDPVERAYCQKRYIEAKTNKEIAKNFKCSLRKVYYIRKSVLQKIKNL